MNTHLKHYVYFTVGQAGKIVGSMLATAILARYLDPAGLGRWTMLVAAATFLHALFANWLQQDPFLRFGKQEWVEAGTLSHTWGVRLPLLVGGVALSACGVIGFWPWIQGTFHISIIDALLVFAYFIQLLISIDLQSVLQITGHMDRLAIAPMLIAIASVPLYLGLWFSRLPHHRVEISLLGTILLVLVIWFAVGGPVLRQTCAGFSGWHVRGARKYLHYAWPILPTAVLGYLMNWGNQILIHRNFSNVEVGLYQSAFQVHTLGVALAVPFTTILAPNLIDKHLRDPHAMARFIRHIAPSLFALWLLMVIPGIAILPWLFVKIYGPSFGAAVLPLTALLAGTPFCALGQIYTGLFTVQGKLGAVFWVILVMAGVNFLGAWVLIPHDRITVRTIAFAFTAAFILAQFLVYFYQHHTLQVPAIKTHVLTGLTVVFAAGQCLIFPLGLRVLWSALITLALVGLVRQGGLIDGPLLKQLFAGRLDPVGTLLRNILVADRKAALS